MHSRPFASIPLTAASAAVLALALPAGAQTTPTHDNLVYAVVGGKALELDLYLPAGGSAPYPLLVFIHGGTWSAGTKDGSAGVALPLLQQGFAVASVGYRLTSQAGQYGSEPVVFPAQIHDVKGALRWLRANGWRYNLDPQRFATWGPSAGGHLAALAALSSGQHALEGAVGGNLGWSSALQAWVDYFGPSDILFMNEDVTFPPGSGIDHDAPQSPESRLIGWDDPGQGIGDIKAHLTDPTAPYPALVALTLAASPVNWVSPAAPAGFIAHGANDVAVPTQQSVKLHAALVALGVDASLTTVPGVGHGALGVATDNAARAFLVARFLPIESVYLPALSTLQPAPAIGSSLTLELAAAPGSGLWQVYGGSPASAPIALPELGSVLLDLSSPVLKLAQGGFPGGTSSAQPLLQVPADPTLQGSTHVLQGVAVTGPLARLTNALTIFVQ
ncbi:MAG: alpha/beta hydrolase [Planctomycetes bacterium]|nr:alpha/beta hydrolase [Planctomycetota bacterium]